MQYTPRFRALSKMENAVEKKMRIAEWNSHCSDGFPSWETKEVQALFDYHSMALAQRLQ